MSGYLPNSSVDYRPSPTIYNPIPGYPTTNLNTSQQDIENNNSSKTNLKAFPPKPPLQQDHVTSYQDADSAFNILTTSANSALQKTFQNDIMNNAQQQMYGKESYMSSPYSYTSKQQISQPTNALASPKSIADNVSSFQKTFSTSPYDLKHSGGGSDGDEEEDENGGKFFDVLFVNL